LYGVRHETQQQSEQVQMMHVKKLFNIKKLYTYT